MNHKPDPDQINLHGIRFPRAWLYQHLLITGMTGSGKTHGVLKPLINQILAANNRSPELRPALVVFDIKGDLRAIIESALARCGRKSDLITVGIGDGEAVFNPLADASLTPAQIAQQLLMAASLSGQEAGQRTKSEELFWSMARQDVLTGLIEMTQTSLRDTDISLNFQHLQRARALLSQPHEELKKWVAGVAGMLSEASASALKEWVRLPAESTRACVSSSVGSILAPWTRAPLSQFVIPNDHRPLLNLPDIVQHGRVVVINAAQTEHAEELWPACVLLKQALFRLALTRARQSLNQQRMVTIIIDEATRLISPHNHLSSEHIALEAARSNRVAIVLAAQNLSGLNAISGDTLTDKLAALCGTQIFLANNCPATLRLAQRCFGNHIVHRRHRTMAPALPAPQLFPDDGPEERATQQVTLVPEEVPRIAAATLARLRTGAARAKLVDGSLHRFQCTFD
jgi:type IV secretory pathway TraG/TraD family ATPase VirD4